MATQRNSKKEKGLPIPIGAFEGKLPPQAPDLERTVIGGIMIEKDAYEKVCELLKPEVFYDSRLAKIYQAMLRLNLDQKPIDLHTVVEQLKRDGTLEEVGGVYALSDLTTSVSTTANIEFHARIIVQKYLARELIRLSNDVLTQAYDEKIDVDELMNNAEGSLFELSQQNVKKDFQKVSEIIPEARKRMDIAAKQKDGISGLATGFTDLDNVTSGWQCTDLIIIAARPAMGKTAFVLSMARNIAVDYHQPVGLFSLEMSNVQLVNRLISNICEIDSKNIQTGNLTTQETRQMNARLKLLEDAPLYLDDTPGLSIFELRTKARRLVREHGVKIIIIDYLQLMTAQGMTTFSREQEVSMISRSLKGLAKELNIPIIALSQLNRNSENRSAGQNVSRTESKRPQLSDLRESGAIEQDADIVCFIHRPEYYKIFEDDNGNDLRGIAELIIAKHRNGAVKDIRLSFRAPITKFQNLNDSYGGYGSSSSQEYTSKINSDFVSGVGFESGNDSSKTDQSPLVADQSDDYPF